MKRFIVYSLIPLLFACKNETSNYISYYQNTAEADYLLFKGDTLRADSIYQALVYSTKRPLLRDICKLIKLEIQIGWTDGIDNIVRLGFRHGLSKEYLFCDSTIMSYYKGGWTQKFPEYAKVRKEYLNTIDTAYRAVIINLIKEDQKYRSFANGDIDNIDSLRMANDAKVLGEIKRLVSQKGYFGFSKIGEDVLWGNNKFNFTDVLFAHVESDSNKVYFYDILKNAVLNGDLYPESYAYIVDYDWIKRDAFKQQYGTTNFSYKNSYYAFPLINEAKIDSIRGEIGLIDWKRFQEMYNIKYDPSLKLW